MKIREIFVSLEQAEKIFEIINDLLSESMDKQIFVEKEFIYSEFQRNNVKHHIYGFNGFGCYHYNKDNDGFGGEDWYGYHESHAFSPRIYSASFISNCKEFFQLVEFPKKNYTHYLKGFEELVLIKVDTKKENS